MGFAEAFGTPAPAAPSAAPTATPAVGGFASAFGQNAAPAAGTTAPLPNIAMQRQQAAVSAAPSSGGGIVAPLANFAKAELPDVGTALSTPTAKDAEGLSGFFDTIKQSFNGAVDDLNNNVDEWENGGLEGKADALGQTMLLPLNVLFSPVTAALKAVQGVPVIGQLADGLNRVFTALGAGGGDAAIDGLNVLPISQEHKDAIAPLVRQLGALAVQIAVGKVGGDVIGKGTEMADDATGGHLAAAKDAIAKSSVGKSVGKAAGTVKKVLGKEVIPAKLTALRPKIAAKTKELGKAVVDAIQDPKSQEIMGNIKPSENLFSKSAALPEAKASVAKPAEMHPTLRGEVRAATDAHGVAATHQALQDELGATPQQAEALVRQAPTPQTPAEELQAHNNALETSNSADDQKTVQGFKQSTGQEPVGENFELGSFGKNNEIKKSGKEDRFPSSELPETLKNITDSYKASSDPKNYRSDNVAHVSKMPNGETRVVYTRLNAAGKEEVINWHKISNPKYVEDLAKNGAPAGSRTRIPSLERSEPSPLADEGISSVNKEPTVVKPSEKEPQVSKIAKSIEQKAIDAGYTKGYGDELAKVEGTTREEQKQIFSDTLDSKGIEGVKDIIRGKAPLPDKAKPGGFIAGVEAYMKVHPEEGKDLAYELMKSPVTAATGSEASGLSISGMREKDSVTARLQQLQKDLVEKAGGAKKVASARKDVISKARTAMKATNLTKEEASWDRFLDGITC